MGKHEIIEDKPNSAGEGAVAAVPQRTPDASVTPRMALVSLDEPTTAARRIDAVQCAAGPTEPAESEPGSIDTAGMIADDDEPSVARASVADAMRPDSAAGSTAEKASPRVSRFTMLAALLALAAALGAMAGALAAFSFLQPGPAPASAAGKSNLEEILALKENVVQARVELAALKVSLDTGNRSANAQFTKIYERIERIDRTQAEPAAKLNKAIEILERMSRADITGSAPPAGAAASSQPAKPNVVEGWLVRDVHRGTALLEGRTGVIEVDQGDVVPGLGRVESIRKQDGRWVVVTSKGQILSPR